MGFGPSVNELKQHRKNEHRRATEAATNEAANIRNEIASSEADAQRRADEERRRRLLRRGRRSTILTAGQAPIGAAPGKTLLGS